MTLPKQTRPLFTLPLRQGRLLLGRETKIMGILNITPDSFSGDGCLQKSRGGKGPDILHRARAIVRQGADILDIGGESSRPGAKPVSAKEEIRRVIPAVKSMTQKLAVPVSVDTTKVSVARHALDAGASIINTIRGTPADPSLLKMVQRYDAVLVLMHMRGTPRTMQKNTKYPNLINDIVTSLKKSIEKCLEIGIRSDKIIIDPGIGFGKTAEQNLCIINRLLEFQRLKCPILIGPSRKSFIGNILHNTPPERTWGTAASVAAGVLRGAHLVRVHDTAQMKQVAMTADAILNEHIDG